MPGLKRCSFLVENRHTFVILSIWDDEAGFLTFGTGIKTHLGAANGALSRSKAMADRPMVWSTEWQIRVVSHNLQWGEDSDWEALRHSATDLTAMAAQPQKPQSVER